MHCKHSLHPCHEGLQAMMTSMHACGVSLSLTWLAMICPLDTSIKLLPHAWLHSTTDVVHMLRTSSPHWTCVYVQQAARVERLLILKASMHAEKCARSQAVCQPRELPSVLSHAHGGV